MEATEQGDHFDGGIGGLLAGVTVGPTAAVPGLLFVVGGQDAEDEGEHFASGDFRDAAGALAGDEVKVRGFAADDRAQADDGGESPGSGHGLGGEGDFEGPRHAFDDDAFFGEARLLESSEAPIEEGVDDLGVEAGGDNSDAHVVTDLFGQELGHLSAHGDQVTGKPG